MAATIPGAGITTPLTLTTADNTDTLTLTSTEAGADNAPILKMYRNSSSPADSDYVGLIKYVMRNDNSQDFIAAQHYGYNVDVSDGTEDGGFAIDVMKAGTVRSILTATGSEAVFNNGSQDIDFRVESDGNANMFYIEAGADRLFFGKNTTSIATAGMVFDTNQMFITRDGNAPFAMNRLSSDGDLVKFYQAGSEEGKIAVSGSTVSYNAFTGGHWSRLADNSKPTILRGTIMESLDEMCDWYQAVAEVAEATDENGQVVPAHEVKEPIALGSKSVGDAITFTSKGTQYTGKIVKEDDVKHVKCKISDTADSKKVYGVFSNWDDQDDGLDGDVNDMNIAQVGTYIIRVNKDVTVEAGDLLVSNGDGTAKKQDDDIIRSKTVAKVNSNIKVETYSDGSYTVPCTLHC